MAVKVSSVRIDSNILANKAAIDQNLSAAIYNMANAILQTSRMVAPMKTGRLRYSGQVTGYGLEREISYNTPYAAYQERGMRKDGSHVVRRYTTAGTGAHYLEKTAEAIVQKGIQPYLPP